MSPLSVARLAVVTPSLACTRTARTVRTTGLEGADFRPAPPGSDVLDDAAGPRLPIFHNGFLLFWESQVSVGNECTFGELGDFTAYYSILVQWNIIYSF